MLPIEIAYARYQHNEITYAEYRRDYADPEEAKRAAARQAARRAAR